MTESFEYAAGAGTELSISTVAERPREAEIMFAVEAWAVNNSLSRQCWLDLQLCIDELFSNICLHSETPPSSADKELLVSLSLKKEDNLVILILSDTGKEFNPMDALPPKLTAPIEDRSVGGLGIHLVRQTVNRFEYSYKDGKNIVKLFFHAASQNSVRSFYR
ncbi:MAG: ATP-binding protein [Planctomycetaceae bacterium]|nr:ATP-binding protein [Planctomycetaceae bacterium]